MTGLRSSIGTRVVSRASADELGRLEGVVLDVAGRRVGAVQVGKGRKATVVAWGDVTGFGPDAIVVAGDDVLRAPDDDRAARTVKGDLAVLGARVLDDAGNLLGQVDDVELDEASGAVLHLTVGDQRVDADRIRGLGSFALVVAAAPAPTG